MMSHEFAKALLARRNHDLRFVTEVCLPGSDEEGDICRTRMADDRAREVYGMAEDVQVLEYHPGADILDVMLGPVFAGRQGSYLLSPEEVRLLLHLLKGPSLMDPKSPALLKLRESLEDAK